VEKVVMANHYVNNADFLSAIKAYRQSVKDAEESGEAKPQVTNELGGYILKIAQHLAYKPNFINYTFRDEMVSDGIENCLHRDTKILTLNRGPVKIADVVGQTVIVKCVDGEWRPAVVKSYGRQKLYKYQFGSFNTRAGSLTQTVVATANHRWFIRARLNSKKMFDWKDEVVTDLRLGDMLQNVPDVTDMDSDGVIHGLIYGDGCVEKKGQRVVDKLLCTQGREYPFIRVCKQDVVQQEIIDYFEEAGYYATYPPSANGDPVYYMGRDFYKKDLPFNCDPKYIAGFIYGWWLADGNKTAGLNRYQITTTNPEAVEWLRDYASYGGYQLTGVYTYESTNGFSNARPLYQVALAKNSQYKTRVRHIEEFGEDEVFCVEEPVTHSFTLANGILTGNCLMYIDNFDPEKSSNPFAYFTQIIYYAFIRRIQKEKKQTLIKGKIVMEMPFDEFDVQEQDEDGTFINSYRDFMQNSGVFDEILDKEEKRKAKKKKAPTLDDLLEDQ
jgi:hypothetical protein